MNKKLALLIPALLLAGCTNRGMPTSTSVPSTTSDIPSIPTSATVTSEEPSSTTVTSEVTSQSSKTSTTTNTSSSKPTSTTATSKPTSTTTAPQPTSTTTAPQPTSETTATTSTPSSNPYTNLPTTHGDDYIEGRNILPIGNVQIDAPRNINNPINLKTSTSSADWLNYELYDDFPSDDWTFIYGNSNSKGPSGHKASPDFYAYDSGKPKDYPGGLKFDQKYKGFQTPAFHHNGEKLEVRLTISQVRNSSAKAEEGKDTGYIYCYDQHGFFIPQLTTIIEEESITVQKAGQEMKYYITGDFVQNVSYFEVRLNAQTYKGSQSYNFGISKFAVKSWTYA